MLGYTEAELKAHAFTEFTHPDNITANLAGIQRVERGEMSTFRMEKRYLHKDGSVVWADMSTVFVRDAVGNPCYLVTHSADITERKQAEETLRKINRTLQAYSHSNQALLHATDETAYLQEVCKIIVEDCGHSMVWAGFAEDDDAKTVAAGRRAGFEEGYLETLQFTWADSERGRGPTGTAIRTGQVSACRNMLTDPAFLPWREQALRRGYAASLALPLLAGDRAFGALDHLFPRTGPILGRRSRAAEQAGE